MGRDCENPDVCPHASISAHGSDATIRIERGGDRRAIAAVVEAAFGSASEARLVEAIRDSPNYVPDLSLVAELEGRVVGHVMISVVELHGATQHRIASLSPLAVDPGFQRRGIGSALVLEAVRRADVRGEPLVILEGSPAFYGRLGFEYAVPYGIHMSLPSWAPPEAAQVRRLAGYNPRLRGRVVYPPAFDDVVEQ
jgi:putative acetyltransferase